MPLHLYGVVRADHPIPTDRRGVGEPPGPVSLVEDGNLGVAVGPIAPEVALTEEDAVRHLDVLVDLLSDGPVLPLRFGTVAPDEDAVIGEVLAPAASQFEANLDALDGLVELQLVVTAREADELAAVVAERPALRAQADAPGESVGERIALGEMIDAQLRQRRARRFELIDQRLEPHCRGIVDLSSDDPTTNKIAALVPAAQLDEFDSVVGALFNDLGRGYECAYIGPLPAADFVGIGWSTSRRDGSWGWTESENPSGRWGW